MALRKLSALLCLGLLILAGCSSDDPVAPSFSTAQSMTIDGTLGGTVTVDAGSLMGTQATFPSGAVAADTTVSIAVGPGQSINDVELERVSPTIRFQAKKADGSLYTTFDNSQSVTIKIPVDRAKVEANGGTFDDVGLFSSKDDGTEPSFLQFSEVVGEDFVTAQTTHFSLFFLMRRKAAQSALTTVSAVSPASGSTAGGNTVTITGRGFVNPVSVMFGGSLATNAIAVTSSRITCVAPAGSAGVTDVSVESEIGSGSKSMGYTYAAPTGGGAASGSWMQINMSQPPVRRDFALDGNYIFGGNNGSAELNDFWRVNTTFHQPANEQLLGVQLSSTNAPSARERAHMQVFYSTTEKTFVWGGRAGGVALGDGGIYDVTNDTWTAISNTDAPSARWGAAVWQKYGSDPLIYVWGGANESGRLGDGAVYNPKTDTWTAMSGQNAPSARNGMAFGTDNSTTAWVFGGFSTADQNDLYSYDLTTDTWQTLTPIGTPPSPRRGPAFGFQYNVGFAIWGGESSANGVEGNGAFYDPTLNTWTTMATAGAPSARQEMAFVRGGAGLFIYGGLDASANPVAGGGFYDWNSKTWKALPTLNAPSTRGGAQAGYWGQYFVWGGRDSMGDLNDGGVFNPEN